MRNCNSSIVNVSSAETPFNLYSAMRGEEDIYMNYKEDYIYIV
jgi:hypothetical protein